MKRIKSDLYPIIKQIKPLFWKECRFCGKEFKREIGYKIKDSIYVTAHTYSSYCCNDCAKDIKEVKELVKKSKNIKPPKFPKITNKSI